MIKLSSVGIEFRDQIPSVGRRAICTFIELQVVTILADDGFGEVGRLVAVGPVEGWFENNLL